MHEPSGLLQQGLLVDPETLDEAILGIFPVADKVAQNADHPLCLLGLLLAARQLLQAAQEFLFLLLSFQPSQLKLNAVCIGRKVLDVAEDRGNESGRLFVPTRPGDINLTGTTHTVFFKVRPYGVADGIAAFQFRQVLEEGLITGMLKILNHRRVLPDDVRYVQQRQPHFGGDVVGYRLRKRVGGTLFAQPFFHFLIDPTRD
ncbi:MAG: hypothetical protein A4E52_02224 [Pelotomaculum sp. PtaB.Bin013]|nr:MAG: hypothetical protein A4E52_02224 [Pelotomaculum sp. PtaB.Bin013]